MRKNLAEHNVKLIKQDEVAELASAGNAKVQPSPSCHFFYLRYLFTRSTNAATVL